MNKIKKVYHFFKDDMKKDDMKKVYDFYMHNIKTIKTECETYYSNNTDCYNIRFYGLNQKQHDLLLEKFDR